MKFVTLATERHVCTLTIRREEALNALNIEMLSELGAAISEVEANDDIYVIVLTGAGRSFVAGADIEQMKNLNAVEAKRFSDAGNAIFSRLENMEKPVIAAINGFALGGGCELSMACDIRIASQTARFGQPEVGLGITPGFGGTQRLPRLVGTSKALEIILTGRTLDADEALSIGLVNQVVAPEILMVTALNMARRIASQAQIAVRSSKQCIRQGMQVDIKTATSYESLAFAVCCDTEDKYDAMDAFISKRKLPSFKNR
ncbi:MAG: enoyl-CoA hydratase/isomerase family protein [Youngiibacter sp.]|nr:enoyl-CoA hydratase/isomerase family protein [Youngiibacter sp.]